MSLENQIGNPNNNIGGRGMKQSLGELTKSFLSLIKESKNQTVDLNVAEK
jgi:hypothetical protein